MCANIKTKTKTILGGKREKLPRNSLGPTMILTWLAELISY